MVPAISTAVLAAVAEQVIGWSDLYLGWSPVGEDVEVRLGRVRRPRLAAIANGISANAVLATMNRDPLGISRWDRSGSR